MKFELKRSLLSALIVLAPLVTGAMAQQGGTSAQDHEQHHPAGSPGQLTAPAPAAPAGATGTTDGMMPMMGGSMMRMMGGGPGAAMPRMQMADQMGRHVEGRLAFLKAELKITDAQMPAWNAFADAARANAKAMEAVHPEAAATATVPQRIEQREKALAGHLEALRRTKAAIVPLYGALTDEQKKIADELMLGPMGFAIM